MTHTPTSQPRSRSTWRRTRCATAPTAPWGRRRRRALRAATRTASTTLMMLRLTTTRAAARASSTRPRQLGAADSCVAASTSRSFLRYSLLSPTHYSLLYPHTFRRGAPVSTPDMSKPLQNLTTADGSGRLEACGGDAQRTHPAGGSPRDERAASGDSPAKLKAVPSGPDRAPRRHRAHRNERTKILTTSPGAASAPAGPAGPASTRS